MNGFTLDYYYTLLYTTIWIFRSVTFASSCFVLSRDYNERIASTALIISLCPTAFQCIKDSRKVIPWVSNNAEGVLILFFLSGSLLNRLFCVTAIKRQCYFIRYTCCVLKRRQCKLQYYYTERLTYISATFYSYQNYLRQHDPEFSL